MPRVNAPEKKAGKGHSIYLDRRTTEVLTRLSQGHVSSFIRGLIWQEHGRHIEREEMAKREGIKV